MKFRQLKFILLFLFITYGCSYQYKEIKDIFPLGVDGAVTLQMNHIGEQTHFFGKWDAPQLGRNKEFFRFLKESNSGVNFELLKKESIQVEVDFYEEVSPLKILINDRAFPFSGQHFRRLVPLKNLKIGRNSLNFVFSNTDKIPIQEIRLYPKRFLKLKNKFNRESDYLTPVRFHYFLNPIKRSKLRLSFFSLDRRLIKGKITIESEKNKKEYQQTISNRKGFQISMLDQSLHHIRIEIPETKSGFIRLTKSQLIEPRKKNSLIKDLRSSSKTKNILIILLDAARADHMSCYGYHRQTTPYIDRLAEKGIQFNNTYSEAAYTLASTGTLLTGLAPDFHGVVSAFFSSLRKETTTFPETLKLKGYFTAAISSNPFFSSAYNYHKGFDQFIELFKEKKIVDAEDFFVPFENIIEKVGDKNFFIYLHFREPHRPYRMPVPFFGRYQKKYKNLSKEFAEESKRIYNGEIKSPSDSQFLTDIYDENLAFADHIVGKILDILRKKQLFDNTITVITADHGEALGEHKLVGHNVVLHREGIHIPLIIYIPRAKIKPKIFEQPAMTSDLVVTLCDLLDIDYPYPKLTQGMNLFSLPVKRTRICRSTIGSNHYSGYMIESFPYKSIIFPQEERMDIEFFNIIDDPDATIPLTNADLPKKCLMFFLNDYIERAAKGFWMSEKTKLGEKELESLRSLGYIKK